VRSAEFFEFIEFVEFTELKTTKESVFIRINQWLIWDCGWVFKQKKNLCVLCVFFFSVFSVLKLKKKSWVCLQAEIGTDSLFKKLVPKVPNHCPVINCKL
jgi:hypothetical protein